MVLKLVLECLVEMVFQNSWFFLLFSLKKKKSIYILHYCYISIYIYAHIVFSTSVFQQVSPGTIFCLGAKTRIVTFFHGSDRKYCCLIFFIFFLKIGNKVVCFKSISSSPECVCKDWENRNPVLLLPPKRNLYFLEECSLCWCGA